MPAATSQTISVVLATHNGERFLQGQLDSLLAQTRPPAEIVISDDNSSDGTLDIVREFEARSPVPVVRIRNVPGIGFRENFIRASVRASGGWIAFCDQDDVWLPQKLETCARFFDEPGITQIAHCAELIDREGKQIGVFKQRIHQDTIRPPLHYDVWRTFNGFSQVFRRDLLEIVPPEARFIDYIAPKHRIAHDRWVFFLAQVLGRTAEIATPLVKYRQHADNLYGAKRAAKPESRETVRRKHLAYIEATSAMLRIIDAMPPQTEALFPAFDRKAARALYRAASAQVNARGRVYAANRALGLARVLSNLAAGSYRSVHGGQQRWRSIAKDLYYCVAPA